MDKVEIQNSKLFITSSKDAFSIDADAVTAFALEIDTNDWRLYHADEKKPYKAQEEKTDYGLIIYFKDHTASIKCTDKAEMDEIYSQLQTKLFGYQHQLQQPVN